jgi:hypothetical protein
VNYFQTASDCEVEHIIPFSSRWKGCKLDIDRLGNLLLLSKPLNAKRGNGRITDTFIRENRLIGYPSENEYNRIVDDKGNIKSRQEYNVMCEIRETMYIDKFIENHF